jgi:hypothetical protein
VGTGIKGAQTPVILITAKTTLAAGTACLCLTVTQESGDLWSELGHYPVHPAMSHPGDHAIVSTG